MTTQRLGIAAGLLFSFAVYTDEAHAQATSSKPLLSKEIRSVFEKSGAAAAQNRYKEIVARDFEAWEFDSKGVMDVASEYMKGGDMAAALVFMGIAGEMGKVEMQRMQQSQQNNPVLARAQTVIDSADRAERERQAAMPPELRTVRGSRGVARSDLARFNGVYGDPAKQKFPRNYI